MAAFIVSKRKRRINNMVERNYGWIGDSMEFRL